MPTITYKRIWCKTCDNFELHHIGLATTETPKEYTCKECKTVYTDIKLGEIPFDKIQEQRKRYIAKKKNPIEEFLSSAYMRPERNILHDIMSGNDGWGVDKHDIIESDAGQKYLDDIAAEERRVEYEKKRAIREEQRQEAARYSKLGRNDICLCGSEKKYKKCCQIRINSY